MVDQATLDALWEQARAAIRVGAGDQASGGLGLTRAKVLLKFASWLPSEGRMLAPGTASQVSRWARAAREESGSASGADEPANERHGTSEPIYNCWVQCSVTCQAMKKKRYCSQDD